jgi:hypothetical protein
MIAIDGSDWRERGAPAGRTVIASEAKQSSGPKERLDCFVALLLAMTEV